MGNWWSSVLDALSGTKHRQILLLGLDAAGKTTILYRLNLAETVHTIPTVGFNVERVRYKNIEFDMWDVGGQTKLRPLWHHYYRNAHAVIFVVDSADKERFEEAQEELHAMMNHDLLRDAALLILANKQDLPDPATTTELSKALQLDKLRGHTWYIQPCCATSGDGLYEGLDWLSRTLND